MAVENDRFVLKRPILGWLEHRIPIDNLYLRGSGIHGGGGVSGTAGRSVVKAMK